MKLYEMAKQIAATDKPMDPIMFNQTMLQIGREMFRYNYVMLLCNERRDFTIFHNNTNSDNPDKKFAKELAETICNRGQVLYADMQKDNSWEIWIRDITTNENFAYYLFNYSDAVVEV